MITPEQLVEQALQARMRAYAPYSGYEVGAAVLTADGHVALGCNVENASYPATICGAGGVDRGGGAGLAAPVACGGDEGRRFALRYLPPGDG